MVAYSTPGVYREDVFPPPAPTFLTGVPCFLGYSTAGQPNTPQRLTLWPQFQQLFGGQPDGGYLADAVRGFFENDGLVCYVVRLDDAPLADALRHGLDALDMLSALNDGDDVDLICAPDIMRLGSGVTEPNPDAVKALQLMLLDYCQLRGDRFAILDSLPTADTTNVLSQAQLRSNFGALYYPWLYLGLDSDTQAPRYAPPCGHIAGSYSRSDGNVGVHKAPANDEIDGVLDLRTSLGNADVALLYAQGVNCLRAFPGRGIRAWGARTLSDDTSWQQINARRVFITISRWVERFMSELAHEPNDVRLWVRIMREVTAYLDTLFQRGALKGATPNQAFFVKCDSETNPPSVIDAGMAVTHIGVALAAPAEFIVVRVIHGASGVEIKA